jgi:hypothetical protein
MHRVPASDVERDTLSVIQATAAALGLPLLVLEARDDGRFPATGGSPSRALVLVTRQPSREAAEASAAPPSPASDVEVGTPQVSPPPRSAVSGEGGIVRFTLGVRDERVAS